MNAFPLKNEPESILIRIAGIELEIRTRDPRQKELLKDYLIDRGTPLFSIEIKEEERNEIRRLLQQAHDDSVSFSPSYLEFEAIHVAISEHLIDYDILTMHGSALSMDQEAYIFSAPSGTGKSTHARLWREVYGNRVRMVNDDKPMLICKEHEIFVSGTPWNGKHHLGENRTVRLQGIVFLERAAENRIVKADPSAVFEQLYQQTFHPGDPMRGIHVMELLSRISRNVSMYRLFCNMEKEAATVCHDGMCPFD